MVVYKIRNVITFYWNKNKRFWEEGESGCILCLLFSSLPHSFLPHFWIWYMVWLVCKCVWNREWANDIPFLQSYDKIDIFQYIPSYRTTNTHTSTFGLNESRLRQMPLNTIRLSRPPLPLLWFWLHMNCSLSVANNCGYDRSTNEP